MQSAMQRAKLNEIPVVVSAMDFTFIGGSMGSALGEKIARAINKLSNQITLHYHNNPAAARMQEACNCSYAACKNSAWLAKLAEYKLPYIRNDRPDHGWASASYLNVGRFNIASLMSDRIAGPA